MTSSTASGASALWADYAMQHSNTHATCICSGVASMARWLQLLLQRVSGTQQQYELVSGCAVVGLPAGQANVVRPPLWKCWLCYPTSWHHTIVGMLSVPPCVFVVAIMKHSSDSGANKVPGCRVGSGCVAPLSSCIGAVPTCKPGAGCDVHNSQGVCETESDAAACSHCPIVLVPLCRALCYWRAVCHQATWQGQVAEAICTYHVQKLVADAHACMGKPCLRTTGQPRGSYACRHALRG